MVSGNKNEVLRFPFNDFAILPFIFVRVEEIEWDNTGINPCQAIP